MKKIIYSIAALVTAFSLFAAGTNIYHGVFIGDGSQLTGTGAGKNTVTNFGYATNVTAIYSGVNPAFVTNSFTFTNISDSVLGFMTNGQWVWNPTLASWTNTASKYAIKQDTNANTISTFGFPVWGVFSNASPTSVLADAGAGFTTSSIINIFSTQPWFYFAVDFGEGSPNVTGVGIVSNYPIVFTNLVFNAANGLTLILPASTNNAQTIQTQPYLTVLDTNGNVIDQEYMEASAGGMNDRMDRFSLPLPNYNPANFMSPTSGLSIWRVNGGSPYVAGNDNRGWVEVVSLFGTNGALGSIAELLTKKTVGYTNKYVMAGDVFAHPIRLDSHARVMLGNIPQSIHTTYVLANASVEIVPAGSDTAQLVLDASQPYSGTSTNGHFRSDGTNVYLTEAGATAPIALQGGPGSLSLSNGQYVFWSSPGTNNGVVQVQANPTNLVGNVVAGTGISVASTTNNGVSTVTVTATGGGGITWHTGIMVPSLNTNLYGSTNGITITQLSSHPDNFWLVTLTITTSGSANPMFTNYYAQPFGTNVVVPTMMWGDATTVNTMGAQWYLHDYSSNFFTFAVNASVFAGTYHILFSLPPPP